MLFNEMGNNECPTIILLHGGGLSDWSWQKVIEGLQADYHIVTPILDGHGVEGKEEFISIEDSAKKLIAYIDHECKGAVFAIGGLSIGAQIVTEALSQRADIARYAIIESALVYPIKGVTALTVPMYHLCYGLIKKRWFAKMQAKELCVPPDMFERYYQESQGISKQSLMNLAMSNGNYALKNSIAQTRAKVLIIVGAKEISPMKKSAQSLHERIANSELFVAAGRKHGEMSLVHTQEYLQLARGLFAQ